MADDQILTQVEPVVAVSVGDGPQMQQHVGGELPRVELTLGLVERRLATLLARLLEGTRVPCSRVGRQRPVFSRRAHWRRASHQHQCLPVH